MLECNDAEMGPANLLHASAYYSEYNERFDLNSAIPKSLCVSRKQTKTGEELLVRLIFKKLQIQTDNVLQIMYMQLIQIESPFFK